MVVPTGLFPVQTGIYMPNNFKGLDRRPFPRSGKKSEIFPMNLTIRRTSMPYKDPEERRTYQREYKRRQRAAARGANPNCQPWSNPGRARQTGSQTVKRKAYLCPKVPNYRIAGVGAFKNGFLITELTEEQRRIESDPLYGEEIFSWILEP